MGYRYSSSKARAGRQRKSQWRGARYHVAPPVTLADGKQGVLLVSNPYTGEGLVVFANGRRRKIKLTDIQREGTSWDQGQPS